MNCKGDEGYQPPKKFPGKMGRWTVKRSKVPRCLPRQMTKKAKG
jgi:hypothetical protein